MVREEIVHTSPMGDPNNSSFTYYSSVIYPYERQADGKLWLVMGMSEGVLQFDTTWALEATFAQEATAVPQIARRKPRVSISK